MAFQRDGTMKELVRYLRVSGTLLPHHRLLLRPSYLHENPRGAVNVEDSPLQIELYEGERLLLRWGVDVGDVLPARRQPAAQLGRELPRAAEPRAAEPRAAEPRAAEPRAVRANVPFPPGTDRILFRYDGILLEEIPVPEQAPAFEGGVRINREDGDRYRIEWSAGHPAGLPLFYHVRASADGGASWTRLASRLQHTEIDVPREALAGAGDCVIEIVAYDGVNTVTARAPVPDAPAVRLEVHILSPRPGDRPIAAPVRLRALGMIHGRRGSLGKQAQFLWTANGEKIAEGQVAVWYDAEPGRYEIELHARAGDLQGSDCVEIETMTRDPDTKP